jgi:exosortase/archaeosortase family protein
MQSSTPPLQDQHSAPSSRARALLPLALFVVLFLTIAHALGNILPDAFLLRVIRFTGSLVVLALHSLGISASQAGAYITVAGYTMEVSLECTALHYLALFAAGVVVFPRTGIRHKTAGIILGSMAILLLNVVRISVVGIIGSYSADAAEFVHTYLWQVTFAFFVLGIWMLWAGGPSVFGRQSVRSTIIFFITAAAVMLGLGLVLHIYATALAWIVNGVLQLIPLDTAVSSRAIGTDVVFVHAAQGRGYSIATDVMDSALFVALMAASWRSGRIAELLRALAVGMSVIIALQIAWTLIIGVMIFTFGNLPLQNAYWIIRAVSMAAPIVLWVLLRDRAKASDRTPSAASP